MAGKQDRKVRAHKRRIRGRVVHVKGYCRRPPESRLSRSERQKKEMPF